MEQGHVASPSVQIVQILFMVGIPILVMLALQFKLEQRLIDRKGGSEPAA